MKNKEQVFCLYACCRPVKGAAVSIVCDLQRGGFIYIPNACYEVLTQCRNQPLSAILKVFEDADAALVEEYFEYLIHHEYGFYTDEPERFPDMDLHFETPDLINNAIIDHDAASNHPYPKIFGELEMLGCKFLELRFFAPVSMKELKLILEEMRGRLFRNVDVYLPYTEEWEPEPVIAEILAPYSIVGNFMVHSSPRSYDYWFEHPYMLRYKKQVISSASCCGNISMNNFSVNVRTFTEALHFNSCLNKKISIDAGGRVMNCPSMKEQFGHCREVSLLDVVKKDAFNRFGNLTKDQISVCKDCQFRYICTDCRAYLNDPLAKPSKCGYDPYQNTWAGEPSFSPHALNESRLP